MRAGGERRGNADDRKRRKLWLLQVYGDGTSCQCVFCGETLTFDTLTVDRIEAGGSYERSNIQPACGMCNRRRSNKPVEEFVLSMAA